MQGKEFIIKSLRSISARVEMKIPNIDFEDVVLRNFGHCGQMNVLVIGANDGMSFDNYAELLFSRRQLRGVMVEPIRDYYLDLENNFKHNAELSLINAAIGDGDLTLWKICEQELGKYNEGARGLASQYRQHLIDCGIEESDIRPEKVKCISVEEVKDNIEGQLDFLQIDTEGLDYEIFKGLEIESLIPAMCKIEVVHMKYWDVIAMVSSLHNLGYLTQFEDGDCFAFLPKLISI